MSLKDQIGRAAYQHELREDVLSAIIWQESAGNPFAFRFEPRFYSEKIEPLSAASLSGHVPKFPPNLATEKILRACSIGLMQLLGETIRWHSRTKAPYLTAFFDPDLNLEAGCAYFRHLLDNHQSYEEALRFYNGSGLYPPRIMDHVKKKSYLAMFSS